MSADSIVPGYANPQNLNRYSYVTNNPLRYTDPTGHMLDDGCRDYGCNFGTSGPTSGAKSTIKKKPGDGGGSGDNGVYQPSVVIPENLPCGGLMNCDQQSVSDYAQSLIPFTSSDACYFLAQDPILCNSTSWPYYPGLSMNPSSANPCLQDFRSCYDANAIMWGAGFSGSMPGIYGTAGLEEIVMLSNGTRAVFSYGGEGSSVGAGASGAAYGGMVFNLGDPDNYIGPFGSAGFTISILDVGLTASYIWDSSKKPFSAGTTQGLAVGYAPGAQVSAWWSSTVYSEIWRSDR